MDNRSTMANLETQILSLYGKYKQSLELQHLEAAVEATHKAVEIATRASDLAYFLDLLGELMLERFRRTGSDDDLEASVQFATQALGSIPENDPMWPGIVNNLALKLRQRSHKTSSTNDLEKGIQLCKRALSLPTQYVHFRQRLLSTLGILLGLLFRRRGDMDDLQEAIQVSRETLTLADPETDNKAIEYNNLGNRLENLYDWAGNPDHLNEAIQCAREAVRCTLNEILRASRLTGLGKKLISRYNRTMELDDLDHAIECLRDAVKSPLNSNDIDWPGFANQLARGLKLRYDRTGDESALNESIHFQRQAIEHKTLHHSHPSRPGFIGNLGVLLMESYKETGHIKDLEAAIKLYREAIKLGEESGNTNHPAHLERRHNLVVACYTMQFVSGSQKYPSLEEASLTMEDVNSRMPDDHPTKATFLMMSGMICHSLGDIDRALEYYIQSAENAYALPATRVISARDALRICQNREEWDKAILLVRKASKLLPLVCSRYISLRDQQHAITNISGFAADACSLFLMSGRPEEALQQLEFGRGLILSYLVDGKSDISIMKEDPEACELVEHYESLRDQLSQASETDRPSGRRDQLVDEIEKCTQDIRTHTKFERFLLGPAIEEIKSTAPGCPIVIINITDIASHAIIVWKGEVTSLVLEQVSIEAAPPVVRKRLERHGLASRGEVLPYIGRDIIALEEEDDDDDEFLSWLWASCVRLALAELESLGLPLNGEYRVWWIGTGAAGSFPFHAAGMHSSCPAECTLMKVISSYAPSIKTLKFSMSQSTESIHVEGLKSLLFVGMPTTPGGSGPLPGVLEEESVIRNVCAGKYRFEARKHPTADEVLKEMKKSKVVHFACHGSSDPKVPSDSHLLLQKDNEIGLVVDRLSVERLSKVRGKDRSFLAFLSACSTAEIKVASELADEAIHLASIFQVVGFAHTIGALWSASDKACVQVAGEFYRHLFEDGEAELSNDMVARALHSAVRKVKLTDERPEIWAPFVHYGA
ncbi:CHAT domain-containing protein [Fusarium flagelliforme]|uniref:CHAT domain-containing protein n=1 Tax=Fusarium flagelliforme TaxID=2675880 RepID=UPI001E8D38B2|nr:CHAT domain-containing protein [Fusarium flagelliforme]KAH7174990.1 CHAT domain-containing protein [Fusarium flagelliforme]